MKHSVAWNQRGRETVETLRVPTSPQGEHSLAESRYDHWWRLPDVYVGAKISTGFPNTCWKEDTINRQMHTVLVLYQPLPNVGIQHFGMWGMYNLAKAYRSMQKSIANRRVEDWEASNGHTKDTTQLFHGPWHTPVGEHICA